MPYNNVQPLMLFDSTCKMVLPCQLLLLLKAFPFTHNMLTWFTSQWSWINLSVCFTGHRIWSLKYCLFSYFSSLSLHHHVKKWCAKPLVWRWICMRHTKHNSCLIQPYHRCCNVCLCHHSSHMLPRGRTSCCRHQRKACLGDTVGSSLQHRSDILIKLSRNTRTDKS